MTFQAALECRGPSFEENSIYEVMVPGGNADRHARP